MLPGFVFRYYNELNAVWQFFKEKYCKFLKSPSSVSTITNRFLKFLCLDKNPPASATGL